MCLRAYTFQIINSYLMHLYYFTNKDFHQESHLTFHIGKRVYQFVLNMNFKLLCRCFFQHWLCTNNLKLSFSTLKLNLFGVSYFRRFSKSEFIASSISCKHSPAVVIFVSSASSRGFVSFRHV